ncbi:hypothetical protein IQ276_025785 [Desmonostoc muscorum LEGE 12446]|uniref:Uncharacterized protein n=1 Tax=Desmonostoc muscorum LEGE 12446 TaxID=1828758 RepID=A0A8J7A3X6_DESMC|nr:hypothetical protein [Desmonostoc muscorum]MCF2149777.1 hypothetical protein [Desmonostoc muscorum LEGE 12446]
MIDLQPLDYLRCGYVFSAETCIDRAIAPFKLSSQLKLKLTELCVAIALNFPQAVC